MMRQNVIKKSDLRGEWSMGTLLCVFIVQDGKLTCSEHLDFDKVRVHVTAEVSQLSESIFGYLL